ncbi:hypothetical protein BGX28_003973 [Mortierella sp. GBA30]|nr:hypothetical protein BGX28_003973 [Mortierella sp. GBA30]
MAWVGLVIRKGVRGAGTGGEVVFSKSALNLNNNNNNNRSLHVASLYSAASGPIVAHSHSHSSRTKILLRAYHVRHPHRSWFHSSLKTRSEHFTSAEMSMYASSGKKGGKSGFPARNTYVWTEEIDKTIVDMRLEGSTWKEISEAIGRDPAACHQRYIKELDPSLQNWTPQKLERLNALVAEGKSWRQVSDQLLITQAICREKWMSINQELVAQLKAKKTARKKPLSPDPVSSSSSSLRLGSLQETGLISVKRHRWCDHMDALLIDLKRRGLNWRQIGTVFGMVPMTCYVRYHYRLLPQMKSGWVPPEINSSNVPYYLLSDRIRPSVPAVTATAPSSYPSSSHSDNSASPPSSSEISSAPAGLQNGSAPTTSSGNEEAVASNLGIVDEDFSYDMHDDFAPRVWTKEEDEAIIQCRQDGSSFSTIGQKLKIDPRQCYHRYCTALDPSVQGKEWTAGMVEKLRFFVEQGLAWTTIAKDLGFNRAACREKYREISRPRPSPSASNRDAVSQSSGVVTSSTEVDQQTEGIEDKETVQLSEEDQNEDQYGHDEEPTEDHDEDAIDDFQDDYNAIDGDDESCDDGEDDGNSVLLDADASDDSEGIDDGEQIRTGRRSGRSKQASAAEVSSTATDTWDQSSVLREVEKTWTPEEETTLIRHVLRNGTRGWQEISGTLEGRHSPEECRAYWKHLDMPVYRTEPQTSKWEPHREAQFWRLWLENGSNFEVISRKLSKWRGSAENDSKKSQRHPPSALTIFTPEECQHLFKERTSHLLRAQTDNASSTEEVQEKFNKGCVEMALARSKPPVFKWDKEKSVKLQKLVRQRLRTRGVQVNWINWNWVARHVGEGASAQRCSVHWRSLRRFEMEKDGWTAEDILLLEKAVREVGTLFNQATPTSSSPNFSLTWGMDSASQSHGPTTSGFRAIQRFYMPDKSVETLQRKFFLLSDKATGVTLDEYMAIMDAVDRQGEDQWDEVVQSLRSSPSSSSPLAAIDASTTTAGTTNSTSSGALAGWTKGPCRRVWESSYKHHLLYTPWSKEEDRDLEVTVKRIGQGDWIAVSRFFPAKSAWQCRLRWCQLTDPVRTKETPSTTDAGTLPGHQTTAPPFSS